MNATEPRQTFRARIHSAASPAAIYAVLSDLRSGLVWGGEEAPKKGFRLLSMEAPAGSLEVGDRFSSTGDNGNGIFHDSSVVVEAEPGERFGFDTDSTLDRKHGEAFHSTFTHRYTIEPNGDGSTLSYVGEVRPQNYVPWWLRRGFRVMSRLYVERLMPKHLTNLSNLAASRGAVQVPESA